MHYYKRNLGDYAKKAGRLSMLQHGSYTLLIDACYDREQFPTRDEAIEWTWASSAAEIEAVDFVLRKFFTLEGDIYVQKRIQEELAEYRVKADKNKRIALDRETNRRENNTKRAPVVNETPPNHKPITINHKLEAKASLPEPVVPPCPIDSLIDKFTQRLPMLPGIRKSLFKTGKNADAMRTRWRWVMTAEHEKGERKGQRLATSAAEGIDWFDKYFSFVAESDFLTGASGKWTACDLAWLLTASKFESVLSGKYHQKEEVAA